MKIKFPDNKTKIGDKKKIVPSEPKIEKPFKIEKEDLDRREITMCACSASDDNPYQQNA